MNPQITGALSKMVGSTCVDYRDFSLSITRFEVDRWPDVRQVRNRKITFLDFAYYAFVDVVIVFQPSHEDGGDLHGAQRRQNMFVVNLVGVITVYCHRHEASKTH